VVKQNKCEHTLDKSNFNARTCTPWSLEGVWAGKLLFYLLKHNRVNLSGFHGRKDCLCGGAGCHGMRVVKTI
jgi:hypothetical protein